MSTKTEPTTHYLSHKPLGPDVWVPVDPQPVEFGTRDAGLMAKYYPKWYWPNPVDDYESTGLLSRGLELCCPYRPGDILAYREECKECGGKGCCYAFGRRCGKCSSIGSIRHRFRVVSVEAKRLLDATEDEAIECLSDDELLGPPQGTSHQRLIYSKTTRDGTTPDSWYWKITTEEATI